MIHVDPRNSGYLISKSSPFGDSSKDNQALPDSTDPRQPNTLSPFFQMLNGKIIPRKWDQEKIDAQEQRRRDIMEYFSFPTNRQDLGYEEQKGLLNQRRIHNFLTDDVRKKQQQQSEVRKEDLKKALVVEFNKLIDNNKAISLNNNVSSDLQNDNVIRALRSENEKIRQEIRRLNSTLAAPNKDQMGNVVIVDDRPMLPDEEIRRIQEQINAPPPEVRDEAIARVEKSTDSFVDTIKGSLADFDQSNYPQKLTQEEIQLIFNTMVIYPSEFYRELKAENLEPTDENREQLTKILQSRHIADGPRQKLSSLLIHRDSPDHALSGLLKDISEINYRTFAMSTAIDEVVRDQFVGLETKDRELFNKKEGIAQNVVTNYIRQNNLDNDEAEPIRDELHWTRFIFNNLKMPEKTFVVAVEEEIQKLMGSPQVAQDLQQKVGVVLNTIQRYRDENEEITEESAPYLFDDAFWERFTQKNIKLSDRQLERATLKEIKNIESGINDAQDVINEDTPLNNKLQLTAATISEYMKKNELTNAEQEMITNKEFWTDFARENIDVPKKQYKKLITSTIAQMLSNKPPTATTVTVEAVDASLFPQYTTGLYAVPIGDSDYNDADLVKFRLGASDNRALSEFNKNVYLQVVQYNAAQYLRGSPAFSAYQGFHPKEQRAEKFHKSRSVDLFRLDYYNRNDAPPNAIPVQELIRAGQFVGKDPNRVQSYLQQIYQRGQQ